MNKIRDDSNPLIFTLSVVGFVIGCLACVATSVDPIVTDAQMRLHQLLCPVVFLPLPFFGSRLAYFLMRVLCNGAIYGLFIAMILVILQRARGKLS